MKHSKEHIQGIIDVIKDLKGKIKDGDGNVTKELSKSAYMSPELICKSFDLEAINDNDEVLVIDAIEIACQLYLRGIKNVTYIQFGETQDEKFQIENDEYFLGYKYVNIKNKDENELGKLKMLKKFDVILANPPYQGQAKLHQKFFNAAFDMLKDGGVMTFIQPSNPYITAFDIPKKGVPDNTMRDIVVNNYSEVKLLSPLIFSAVNVFYPLAVTTVIKNQPSFKGVDVFTDIERNISKNININDINTTETKPSIHRSMSDKVKSIVQSKLCVKDVACEIPLSEITDEDNFLKLPKLRGNTGEETSDGVYSRKSDFYTWIPGDGPDGLPDFNKEKDNAKCYGIFLDKDVDKKVAYTYFKTYFARFCMSLGKYNQSIMDGHCEKTTPILGFNKVWTDEELFELAGFTDEEIAEVYRIVPSYY